MKLVIVKDREDFEKMIEKRSTFRLQLNGGAFSKYTIHKVKYDNPDFKIYKVRSHFSDTVETCDFTFIMNPDNYHFNEGIEKGALFLESEKGKK